MPRALLVYPPVRYGDRVQDVIKYLSKLMSWDRLIAVKWPELVADLSHAFNVKNRTGLLATHFIMRYSMCLNCKGNKKLRS
jgi:hypothetical protein